MAEVVYVVSAKHGAIVRERSSLASPVVGELATGTSVTIERLADVPGGEGKPPVSRALLSQPLKGWLSMKMLQRQAPEAAAPTAPPAKTEAEKSDVQLMRMWQEHQKAAASRKKLTPEQMYDEISKALCKTEGAAGEKPDVRGGGEPERAVVLGFAGSDLRMIKSHTQYWEGRGCGVWTHVPSADDDVSELHVALVSWLRGARVVIFHAMSNNGYAFLNHFFETETETIGALRGKLFIVLDSAPYLPPTHAEADEMLLRASLGMVCQMFGEPADVKHPVYRPLVERWMRENGRNTRFDNMVDAIPAWAAMLVVYTRKDEVILDTQVEGYLATRPPATGRLVFDDCPHVACWGVHQSAYIRQIERLLNGEFTPPS